MRELDYTDVTAELCQSCFRCCMIEVETALDGRSLEFLRTVGLNVTANLADGTGVINLGYCRHLVIEHSMKAHCAIYENRPQICKDYNCVAVAKLSGAGDSFEAYRYAKDIHSKLQEERKK